MRHGSVSSQALIAVADVVLRDVGVHEGRSGDRAAWGGTATTLHWPAGAPRPAPWGARSALGIDDRRALEGVGSVVCARGVAADGSSAFEYI